MTKNIFVFIVLIIFIAVAAWLFMKKGESVDSGAGLFTSPSPSSTANSSSPLSSAGKIITMENGLQMQDLVVGTGVEAKKGELVTVNYVGTLTNGQKFDSSYDRNQPFQFILGTGMVIQGWDLGVAGIKVGGKRKLVIPAALGYGERANGPIPANSILVFEVELLGTKIAPRQ